MGRLRHLCDEESIEADDHALKLIARHATGSLRDAVSLLDQLASSNSLHITAADVREALGATDSATVKALTDGLIAQDISAGYGAIQRAIDQGADARQIARQMVDYLRAMMQLKASQRDNAGGELSEAERIELSAHAERLSVMQLSKAARAFSEAINEMRGTTDAQLPLEMAYIDCVLAGAEPAPRMADAPHSTLRAEPAQPTKHDPAPPQQKTTPARPPIDPSATQTNTTTPAGGSLTLEKPEGAMEAIHQRGGRAEQAGSRAAALMSSA